MKALASQSYQTEYIKDPVRITVTPDNITFAEGGGAQTATAYVAATDGPDAIAYGAGLTVSVKSQPTSGLDTVTLAKAADGRCAMTVRYTGAVAAVSGEIVIEASAAGLTLTHVIRVTTARKGSQGQSGPAGAHIPPPMLWNKYPAEYQFRTGVAGDDRLDVVLENMGGALYAYKCKSKHVKGSNNPPSQDTAHWQPTDAGNYYVVASEVILAASAFIDIMSSNGIIFHAPGAGNAVTGGMAGDGSTRIWAGATTGARDNAPFRVTAMGDLYATNADIMGRVAASILELKAASSNDCDAGLPDGALCFNVSDITLPPLPVGHVRVIKVVNPLETRTTAQDLVLRPADSTVRISNDFGILGATSATKTITAAGYNSDKYIELLGMNYKGYTYWLFKEL